MTKKQLVEVLTNISNGLAPCKKCNKIHIPHNKKKGYVPQWDNEDHAYYKISLEEYAKNFPRRICKESNYMNLNKLADKIGHKSKLKHGVSFSSEHPFTKDVQLKMHEQFVIDAAKEVLETWMKSMPPKAILQCDVTPYDEITRGWNSCHDAFIAWLNPGETVYKHKAYGFCPKHGIGSCECFDSDPKESEKKCGYGKECGCPYHPRPQDKPTTSSDWQPDVRSDEPSESKDLCGDENCDLHLPKFIEAVREIKKFSDDDICNSENQVVMMKVQELIEVVNQLRKK